MNYPFDNTSMARLGDREYYDYVLGLIERATNRIWVSMFIYDIRPFRDVEGKVLNLTTALIDRKGLGVDVKVLLTGHLRTPDIAVANLATGLYLSQFGVPQRRSIQVEDRYGSHAKYVLCDNTAITGSQNWTDNGFAQNIEDGIIMRGNVLNALETEFLRQWEAGKGLPNS